MSKTIKSNVVHAVDGKERRPAAPRMTRTEQFARMEEVMRRLEVQPGNLEIPL